jgi:hypothetical protein
MSDLVVAACCLSDLLLPKPATCCLSDLLLLVAGCCKQTGLAGAAAAVATAAACHASY